MGLNESEAFVLRTYKLAEADKIVLLLTPKAGLLRGVARGARRLKSRYGACFELFTHISLTYHEKEGRELVSIGEAEIMRSYFHLTSEPDTVATLVYWSELLQEFVPPQQPEEKLFRLVAACLDSVAHTRLESHTLYFELWLLKLTGFLPDVRTCPHCRKALNDPRLGGGGRLLCAACAPTEGIQLSHIAHTLLRDAMRAGPNLWTEAAAEKPAHVQHELRQLTRQLITQALERAPQAQRTAIES
jgi:DNA repair protein RecO (recombination protein O)